MHFQLPEQLRDELIEYDSALKLLAAEQKRQSRPRKTTFTLGLPNDLVPYDLCPEEDQLKIARDTNHVAAPDRHYMGVNAKGVFMIFHHESIWYGVWFYNPSQPQSKECVYGVKVAYKATESVRSKVNAVSIGRFNPDSDSNLLTKASDMQLVKYGRQEFLTKQVIVTKEMIANGADKLPFNAITSWHQKTRSIYQEVHRFKEILKQTIPTWEDGGIFDRIRANGNLSQIVFDFANQQELPFDENLIVTATEIKEYKWAATPYFRKEINKVIDLTQQAFEDETTTTRKQIRYPYRRFRYRIERVKEMLSIYPDATVDHIQTMYEIGINLGPIPCRSGYVKEWLCENMPITSYIGMIQKFLETRRQQWNEHPKLMLRDTDPTHDQPWAVFRDLIDTFDMMWQLVTAQSRGGAITGLTLEKPSRWRIADFHDHVSAEAFKAVTPNEKLPQALFPEPIKVEVGGEKWTFFQPHDVHQLALWGNAVRNCVGNASSYKEGIKKKLHFIVLAMVDNKPRFTIQLKMTNGVFNVEQMRDISNKVLTSEQDQAYELAFREALLARAAM